MKRIRLTQQQYALVDDADYKELNAFRWCVIKRPYTSYAMRQLPRDGKTRHTALMHRVILGLLNGDSKQVDHIDGNGLNNQRFNLRVCTQQENQFNQNPQRNRSSVYRGVNWNRRHKRWRVRIGHNGRDIHIGNFTDEIKAANAYNQKAKELFGEFAYINPTPPEPEKKE